MPVSYTHLDVYKRQVVAAANDWPADIFVSLHCNASPGRNARGTETLYYSEQGRLLGEAVQKKILSKVPTIDRGCKERQGLYVLRRTVMTTILVELAFIDNNDDLELLENDMPVSYTQLCAAIKTLKLKITAAMNFIRFSPLLILVLPILC